MTKDTTLSDHIRVPLGEDDLHRYMTLIQPLKNGFDHVRDHVIITDPNANIVYANNAVEKHTGFSIDEIIGKNPADLWGGNMPKNFYKDMWGAIKTAKQPFVGEVKNIRKDGTEYWQEIHISPILDENENVKFFIGIEPNITDRKEKERFREEFISILAHQLKNPLSSVKWTLEWLKMKGGLTSDQVEKINTIYEENESIITLVKDLLVFSRVGNAGQELINFNLDAVINTDIEEIARKNPNVDISFFYDKNISYPITSNKTLTLNVFYNLIANAAEYSDKQEGKVQVSLAKNNTHYTFSVENNGINIPAEDQSQIFSKFFRASNAEERKKSGTGLGLFIVKLICTSFGWHIWFESPPQDKNGGAIFYVEIPIE